MFLLMFLMNPVSGEEKKAKSLIIFPIITGSIVDKSTEMKEANEHFLTSVKYPERYKKPDNGAEISDIISKDFSRIKQLADYALSVKAEYFVFSTVSYFPKEKSDHLIMIMYKAKPLKVIAKCSEKISGVLDIKSKAPELLNVFLSKKAKPKTKKSPQNNKGVKVAGKSKSAGKKACFYW